MIKHTNKKDDEKLGEVFSKLHLEDPTLIAEYSSELRQMILSCQGELHLAVTKWVINNVYNFEVEFFTPRISYRETIQKPASSSYRHKKQSGGAGQFGEVYMKIEPYFEGMPDNTEFNVRKTEDIDLEWGGKLIFPGLLILRKYCSGQALPKVFWPL